MNACEAKSPSGGETELMKRPKRYRSSGEMDDLLFCLGEYVVGGTNLVRILGGPSKWMWPS